MSEQAMLDIDGVTKMFGGLAALKEVSFSVNRGEIKGLIGPNGAGKTTLFNVLTGVYRLNAGSITLNGSSVTGLRPDQITAMGMIRTFQTIQLFEQIRQISPVDVSDPHFFARVNRACAHRIMHS